MKNINILILFLLVLACVPVGRIEYWDGGTVSTQQMTNAKDGTIILAVNNNKYCLVISEDTVKNSMKKIEKINWIINDTKIVAMDSCESEFKNETRRYCLDEQKYIEITKISVMVNYSYLGKNKKDTIKEKETIRSNKIERHLNLMDKITR
jgi:hypothetical protein